MSTAMWLRNSIFSSVNDRLQEQNGRTDVIPSQPALNRGMIATGNHSYSDSLRGAQLAWESPSSFRNDRFWVSARTFEGDCHVALRAPRNDMRFNCCAAKRSFICRLTQKRHRRSGVFFIAGNYLVRTGFHASSMISSTLSMLVIRPRRT